jgi:MinD-like ATPase involved in chromosome partitioning or flagellar assembly
MLIALASVKHSPGVTTAALGLASAWPQRMLLAECDPAGADLASWLALSAPSGLLEAMLELRRGNAQSAQTLWQQAHALDADGRLRLLAGVDGPSQAAAIDAMWPLLAQRLKSLDDDGPIDVLADSGRLNERYTPWPLLEASDIVAVVLQPTVAGVRLTSRWISTLRDRLGDDGLYGPRLQLIVTGSGPYPASEVAEALATPLLGVLPNDPAAAALLGAGGGRGLHRSRLWRALVGLADDLTRQQTALTTDAAAVVRDRTATAGVMA